LGISGLRGHYTDESQSALSRSEGEWLEQVKLIDQHFERLLADLIMGVINHALDDGDDDEHRFIIQGPAFPKLLGRLAYRRILDRATMAGVFFMTFRRRFLLPHPMMAAEPQETYLMGPIPSVHEHSLVKKYYLRPEITGVVPNEQPEIPLMIEVFEHPSEPERAKLILATALQDLGVQRESKAIMVGGETWDRFPTSSSVVQKVPAPRKLLEANRLSLEAMNRALKPKWSDATIDFNSVSPILRLLAEKKQSNMAIGELLNCVAGRVAATNKDTSSPEDWLRLFRMPVEELRRKLEDA